MTLSSPTDGASIAYQLLQVDEDITPDWQVYVQPLKLGGELRLATTAHRIGFKPSVVQVFDLR